MTDGSAYPLDADGVWCEILSRPRAGRPALFLDRDGVLVEEVDYLCRIADVAFIEGADRVIAKANAQGIPVVLVTNQSGVGRGRYGWDAFRAVQDFIRGTMATRKARIDAIFACAHHPDGKGAFAHPNHDARKPNPGMLTRAAKALSLDLAASWLVGDRAIDVQAARNAGLAGALHVRTGYGKAERDAAAALASTDFDVRVGETIADALSLPILVGAGRRDGH